MAALSSNFNPEAVLTVAHGYLWVTATEFAHRHRLPLHLIVHDDWPRMSRLPVPFENRIDRQLAGAYRTAMSRLCVSPFMVDEYRRRYGVDGSVLYPSRAKEATVFAAQAVRLQSSGGGPTFAFAGTINSPGYCHLLRTLADCLERHQGTVLIFGPMNAEQASAAGLDRRNIRLGGLLPSSELANRLRAEADVLFVPMSFGEDDRANMEISFPSKLADYTSVGLPLLICGPEYCSAVRWARENAGVAEVVQTDAQELLAEAVERLIQSPAHRLRLAEKALAVGNRFFSHATARDLFQAALQIPSCDRQLP